jgi:ABC-2 type transport system ATP-binding protein
VSEQAIQTTSLTKRFDELIAVDSLTLNVNKGEIYGLLGPDGAGKTTTVRMLTTILAATSGAASVAGHDVVRQAEQIRSRIGYVSQTFNLYPDLTVSENMDFYAQLFAIPPAEYAERKKELLHFSRLSDFLDRRAGKLSGGMQKKLAVSCALVHEPEILFLDEPTSGVDPLSRLELWEILLGLFERGVTLFATTTYLEEAEHFTRVAFIDRGRVIAEGAPQGIKERFGTPGKPATLEEAWLKMAEEGEA